MRTASLYRMVMPDHICPYGIKTKYLLERNGFQVDDNWLETQEETDVFQREHGVKTTPQTFIDGQRIGGYEELRVYFGHSVLKPGQSTYRPVIAIIAVALLLAVAISWTANRSIPGLLTTERFIAVAMSLLAVQKLQDVDKFSTISSTTTFWPGDMSPTLTTILMRRRWQAS